MVKKNYKNDIGDLLFCNIVTIILYKRVYRENCCIDVYTYKNKYKEKENNHSMTWLLSEESMVGAKLMELF